MTRPASVFATAQLLTATSLTATSLTATSLTATSLTATLLTAALLTACATAGPGGQSPGRNSAASATPPAGVVRSMPRSLDDRLIVRGHSTLLGIASTTRHVYAVTSTGLIVYDRVFSRWDAPASRALAELEDAGVLRMPRAILAADPVEDAVWLGLPGAVVIYRAAGQQVLRVPVVGQTEVIAFAPDDPGHAYVRASGRWTRLSRAGFVAPAPAGVTPALLPPVQLGDVYREYPALRGQLPFVLRTATVGAGSASAGEALGRLPDVVVTSGTFSPDRPSELWLGTRDHGMWRYDVNSGRAEALPYGLATTSVARLARGGDGVWAIGATGPGGGANASGLTFLATDLQRFTWPQLQRPVPPVGARVFAMAARGAFAWVGTDRGAARARIDGSGTVQQWDVVDGVASSLVYAVLPTDDGAWLGTARGLQFVDAADDRVRDAGFGGTAVYALTRFGNELLVGTAAGVLLQAVTPGLADARSATSDSSPPVPPGVRRLFTANGTRLPAAIVLARHDSLMLVASDRVLAMYRLPSSTPAWSATASQAPLVVTALSLDAVAPGGAAWLGPIVAARIDERAVWIAGRNGLLAWSRSGGAPRWVDVGLELPGPITDLVLDAEWAWAGTASGVVRIRRARDGGLP